MDGDNSMWEFNAPQFVDFTKPIDDDSGVADEYFNYDHENGGIPTSFSTTPEQDRARRSSRVKIPQKPTTPNRAALKDNNNSTPRRSIRIKTANTPKAENMETNEKENVAAEPKSSDLMTNSGKILPNICTDQEEWDNRKAAANRTANAKKVGMKRRSEMATSASPVENETSKRVRRSASSVLARPTVSLNDSKTKSHVRRSSSTYKPQHTRTASTNQAQETPRSASLTASKTHARTNSAQANNHARSTSGQFKAPPVKSLVRANSVRGRSRIRTQSSDKGTAGTRSLSLDRKPANPVSLTESAPKQKLTIPTTPAVLRHEQHKVGSNTMSAEERELEQITHLRKELAQRRKMAEESLKMSQASKGYAPLRSRTAPTKAECFNFATDSRIKGHDGEINDGKETDFASSLRSSRGVSGNKSTSQHNLSSDKMRSAPSITKTEPFNLHESKPKECSTKYQSTAEILQAFSSKTPDRFRTKPKNKECLLPKRTVQPSMTIPKTPNFETKSRLRPVTAVSRAEIEEREIEELKKYKFKANPVNEKILKHPNSGLPKVQPKMPTQFESFDLETDRRIRERQENNQPEEKEHYEFHANPVPKGIHNGPTGIKAPPTLPLTKPASPAFALKNRLRALQQQVELKEDQKQAVRANPVPHFGIPFQPKLSHKATEILPFSFETRTRKMMEKKEEKIQRLLEEEKKMREFHANPLPSGSPDSLPPRQVKPPTQPEPFKMEIDIRAGPRSEEWAQKIEEEMKQQRLQANFKAQPAKSLNMQPFVPKRSTKILTDAQEFSLSTDQRKERWAELERQKYEKEAESAALQMARERRKREEEEEEIKRLRTEAVHRANPVRQFKTIEIKPSDKPLTAPGTPRFSTRLRSRTIDNKS